MSLINSTHLSRSLEESYSHENKSTNNKWIYFLIPQQFQPRTHSILSHCLHFQFEISISYIYMHICCELCVYTMTRFSIVERESEWVNNSSLSDDIYMTFRVYQRFTLLTDNNNSCSCSCFSTIHFIYVDV